MGGVGGMESEPMLAPREKSPQPEGLEEGQSCCAAPHRVACLAHCRLSCSGPCQVTDIHPTGTQGQHGEHRKAEVQSFQFNCGTLGFLAVENTLKKWYCIGNLVLLNVSNSLSLIFNRHDLTCTVRGVQNVCTDHIAWESYILTIMQIFVIDTEQCI